MEILHLQVSDPSFSFEDLKLESYESSLLYFIGIFLNFFSLISRVEEKYFLVSIWSLILFLFQSLYVTTEFWQHQRKHLREMQTSIPKTIRVINPINNCFNHSKLGSQDVTLSHKCGNPKEVSSKDTSWNTPVFSQSVFKSVCLYWYMHSIWY